MSQIVKISREWRKECSLNVLCISSIWILKHLLVCLTFPKLACPVYVALVVAVIGASLQKEGRML